MGKLQYQDFKITPATTVTEGAVAMTAINGVVLDMAGYDGVLVIVPVGTIVTTGLQSFKMQQDTALAFTTDPQDLLGTKVTIAEGEADTTFYLDVFKPLERFVRVVVTRGTANSTFGGITYIQYGAGAKPVTHAATVTGGEAHVSPAEGTA